ncbi:MAG: GLPGLI family protein, partial [Sediminibacterium sp.]
MRKLIFILFLQLIGGTLSLRAQADIAFASVRYTLTHISDSTQPQNPDKENMVLYLGKNMSNYTNFDRLELIRTTGSPYGRVMVSRNGGPPTPGVAPAFSPEQLAEWSSIGNYYKDLRNSKMSYIASPGGKLLVVEDNIPAIDWAITQDTKLIMGLTCQKATGDFKGRTYEAWFTTQLPYSNGPWKLGGLPGLIVVASDSKNEVVFTMVSYSNETEGKITLEIPPSVTKTSLKE